METTHPDRGAEMFLDEFGVDDAARGRGVGTALVRALAVLARDRGCHGMWVATDEGNAAAIGAYRAGGAGPPTPAVTLEWVFTPEDSD